MWQQLQRTLFNAQSLADTANYSSAPFPALRTTFVRAWLTITLGSFTSVKLTPEIMDDAGTWFDLYDSETAKANFTFSTNFTGTVQWSANNSNGISRASSKPIIGTLARFTATAAGTPGTPATVTMLITGFRLGRGSHQK